MADPSRGLIIFCVRESSIVHVYIVLRQLCWLIPGQQKLIRSMERICSNTYFSESNWKVGKALQNNSAYCNWSDVAYSEHNIAVLLKICLENMLLKTKDYYPARVSTEFRRHGIPRNFWTSVVISAQFRRNSAKFRGIPPEITSVFRGMPKCHFRGHPIPS